MEQISNILLTVAYSSAFIVLCSALVAFYFERQKKKQDLNLTTKLNEGQVDSQTDILKSIKDLETEILQNQIDKKEEEKETREELKKVNILLLESKKNLEIEIAKLRDDYSKLENLIGEKMNIRREEDKPIGNINRLISLLSENVTKTPLKYLSSGPFFFDLYKNIPNISASWFVKNELGKNYFNNNNYGLAIKTYEEALKIAIESNTWQLEFETLIELYKALEVTGDKNESIEFLNKAINLLEKTQL
jgi:tetratricopeptide (TPR) repeat protein